MERGADPHGVGIDQLLADVGTTVAAHHCGNRTNLSLFQLVPQVVSLVATEILDRLVFLSPARRFVQIVQAVAPFAVGLDGDVVPSLARLGMVIRVCRSRGLPDTPVPGGIPLSVSRG